MSANELEILRKSIVKRIITTIIIVLVVVIVGIILASISNFPLFAEIPLIAGIVIGVIINNKPIKKFNSDFKDTFVKTSLESVFTDLEYLPDEGLNRSIIADTKMMYMGDIYSSNDFVKGKYKNIEVMQADVHIQDESTDSDGNRTYYTLFKGRWMVFDFNKPFKANIQVCEKWFGNNRHFSLGENKYRRVKMEDEMFNKKFKIYAQSEVEAFYILTPHMMERIKKIESMLAGKILFCFVDNKLHVGLYNNKDSFEHSIFKKINEEEISAKVSGDIKIITDFVDELSLDNDLFRKEVQ